MKTPINSLQEDDVFLAQWFMNIPPMDGMLLGGDVLCVIKRSQGEHFATIRVRKKMDDEVWDSNDQKTAADFKLPAGTDDDAVIHGHKAMAMFKEKFNGEDLHCWEPRLPMLQLVEGVQKGTVKLPPYMHVKVLTPEEAQAEGIQMPKR